MTPELQALLTAVAAIVGPYSVVCTKLVDWTRNALDNAGKIAKWAWNAAAFGYGVMIAFVMQLELVLPRTTNAPGWVNTIAAGLAIGGFSGVWHEGLDWLSGVAKARHAEATKMLLEMPAPRDVLIATDTSTPGETRVTTTEAPAAGIVGPVRGRRKPKP